MLQVGQVTVRILRITSPGALLDDDFERVAFVFVEHVVNRASGGGPWPPRTAADTRQQHHDDSEDDQPGDSFRHLSVMFAPLLPSVA